ncbi:hypothetical protein ACEQ8H_005838 [Pleosporales sp. CAS-2024a]
MRPTALIPVLCCIAALVLSFLCLFAGHKASYMEHYHLLTLNTSLLGETLLNDTRSTNTGNTITNLLNSIPNAIEGAINDQIGEITARIGIEDFYSMHMLDYCYGQYVPGEVANATLKQSEIHKNVTGCSASKAMYKFDPTQIVQDALNKTTGNRVTLDDLRWPDDIRTGTRALNALMAAMFVLYVVAICFIFVALAAAILAVLASGRLSACVNFLVATLALLAIGLASALVTAVMVRATDLINKYGNRIGIVATRGGKFLALTWAATALMLIVVLLWIVEFCIGRRRRTTTPSAKHGMDRELTYMIHMFYETTTRLNPSSIHRVTNLIQLNVTNLKYAQDGFMKNGRTTGLTFEVRGYLAHGQALSIRHVVHYNQTTNPYLPVLGIGTVEIPTKRSPNTSGVSSHGTLLLHDVLHVPDSICNFIGPPLYTTDGYNPILGPRSTKSSGTIKDKKGRNVAYFDPKSRLFAIKLRCPSDWPKYGPHTLKKNGLYVLGCRWDAAERRKWQEFAGSHRTVTSGLNSASYTPDEMAFLKKNYGSEYYFLRQHGLKIHAEEDREDGRALLRAMMREDETLEDETSEDEESELDFEGHQADYHFTERQLDWIETHYDNSEEFMISYRLKFYDDEDVEEAKAILDALMKEDD